MKTYDAVIVGAGPAGSIAAKTLAESGASVLVVEKKQEIGTPKRCAEGVNSRGLRSVGIKPDPQWAINEVHGAIVYSPSGKSIEIKLKDETGYIIERKIFEKFLAADAIRAGARYMVKTTALSAMVKDDYASGVRIEHMGKESVVGSKLLIAADGVDSKIARSCGINTLNKLADYHSGIQYEMVNVNANEDMLHIFFGGDVAPKGYAWIFPKGNTVANVGLGILGTESGDGKRAKDYLDRFIEKNEDIFKDASAIEMNAGGIPVSSGVDTFVGNGLMVAGDAAQQVNPIHGGGIVIAMRAAKIAGEVGAAALKEGDLSKGRLYEYEKIWRKTEGKKLKKLFRLRTFLEKLGEDDWEKLADIFTGDHISQLTAGNFSFVPKLILTKAPKYLPLVKKFLI